MNYIYCYINKLNNKKYVGQTNNLQRRIREHSSSAFNPNSSSYNHLIHKKIRQYGQANFDIIVLEQLYDCPKDEVNEREKYWINKLNTYVGNGLGYNETFGGELSYIYHVYSKETIDNIKQAIKSGTNYLDIETQFGVSASFISALNTGYYYFDENEAYPLYQYYKKDDEYDELIELLVNSSLSLSTIAKELHLGYSTVKKINSGKLRHGLYPTYPIRKISSYEQRANEIKELLKQGMSNKQIMSAIDVSDETIRRINLGIVFKDNNISYPIRNL